MTEFSLILLGSNLGEREEIIAEAVVMIGERCGEVKNKSLLYETEPWGFDAENNFLNQAIRIETSMNPHELLEELMKIEAELGRLRHATGVYESRPIDLDIIYYGDKVIDDDDLVLPHPRLHLRRFVLLPLCEIAPEYIHPVFMKNSVEILKECTDTSVVIIYK